VTDAAKETIYSALRDYGFSVVVALAAGWVLRNDVLIPLVEEHRTFVRSLSETQSEISKAVTEQTKLLYEMKHMREQP
jgi:hypothetical protein